MIREDLSAGVPYCSRFRAREAPFKRRVELRSMPRGLPDDQRQSFLAEFQDLIVLDHPAFPEVLDWGRPGGRLFYTTPLRKHLSVAERLSGDPLVEEGGAGLDPRARMQVLYLLAGALSQLAGRGAFDIAPSLDSMLWDGDTDRLTLLHTRAVRDPRDPGLAGGVAPDPAPRDERALVWQWGRVACRVLAPEGGPAELEVDRVREALEGQAPAEVVDLVVGALEPDPARRPKSPKRIRRALAGHLDDAFAWDRDQEAAVPAPIETALAESGVSSRGALFELVADLEQSGVMDASQLVAVPPDDVDGGSTMSDGAGRGFTVSFGTEEDFEPVRAARDQASVAGRGAAAPQAPPSSHPGMPLGAVAAVAVACIGLGFFAGRVLAPPAIPVVAPAPGGPRAGSAATLGGSTPGARRFRDDPYVQRLLASEPVTRDSYAALVGVMRRAVQGGRLPPELDDPGLIAEIEAEYRRGDHDEALERIEDFRARLRALVATRS